MDSTFDFSLLPLGRARVWVGTVPATLSRQLDRVVRCERFARAQTPLSLAVEVAVPRGAMQAYGLLGLTYTPESAGEARAVVCGGEGPAYAEALSSVAPVRWGLPSELADGLLELLDEVKGDGLCPAGEIRFGCAAWCQVGSSPRTFGGLCRVLLAALADPGRVQDKEFWRGLLGSTSF